MRNIIFSLFLIISTFVLSYASGESVKPSYGVKFERPVMHAIIDGQTYFNVIVEIDAAEIDDIFKSGVKVTVTEENNDKKIYKKRFSKSYLYAFSDGTIQIGKGNALTQLILYKRNSVWHMEIREKGIY